LNEHLLTARIDQTFSDNDKVFAHFKYDEGTQPTASDPISPVFNMQSVQPDDEGQLSWTHIFSPRAVNQLLVTGSWYSAIFTSVNQASATALMPETLNFGALDGYFADLNTDGFAFPQGRNVSQVQIGDDFSYSLGKHTFKAGFSFKKDFVSDHDMTILSTPLVLTCGSVATCTSAIGANYGNLFGQGISLEALQSFTTRPDLGIDLYSLGEYIQDDWKPTSNLTLTLGARVERNSNPNCAQNCLSNFGTNFSTFVANVGASAFATTPYSSLIKAGQSSAFPNYQAVMLEPRFGFTYSPTFDRNTVLRGGVGFFTDVFPGTIADTELSNPPLDPAFTIFFAGVDP
jgi:outer membrane receptor protein involved in Fe transport